MSQTRRDSKGGGRERQISVRAVRRDPPDYRKLARTVLRLALAEAAAEAQAEADRTRTTTPDQPPKDTTDE